MFNKKPKHRQIPRVPLRGLFKHRQADQANTLLALHKAYGRFIKFPLKGRLMVADPEIVQHILLTNMENYSKDLGDYRLLTYLMGSGLLTSEGKRWQAQRQVMQSLFHLREMPNYFELTVKAVDRFCEAWRAKVNSGAPVDITREMMSLSLMMTSECLLKTSLSVDVAQAAVDKYFYQHAHIYKTGNLFSWVPLPRNVRYRFAKRFTDKLAYKIYKDNCKGDQQDVVSLMKTSFKEDDVLDQVKTMLATGHETTGLGLSWSWYLLAKNPSCQQKMLDEIQQEYPKNLAFRESPVSVIASVSEAIQENQRGSPGLPLPHFVRSRNDGSSLGIASEFNYESLEKFKYTQMVFQETIRLYPPIWTIPRYAKADDEVAGYKIPANTSLLINIFSLHRLADEWQDPDEFRPERFSKEHREKRHKYAYLPFGAGPHVCIANGLALMQARVAMVLLAKRFKLTLVNPEVDPGIKTYVTLKPRQPILMNISSSC